MEQKKPNTKVAGVDVGKARLDVAVHGSEDSLQVANTLAGCSELIDWLQAREVGRVGLEATGGYERMARVAMEAADLEVVVHQPMEVRLFARLKRRRAKNDRLDARLIAAATAQVEAVRAAQDPRLMELAERLTAYEQVTDLIAQLKCALEHVTLQDVAQDLRGKVADLGVLKAKLLRQVVASIRRHADLLARFQLLMSLPGIGSVVAATLVVRMPELGALRKGQAAALAGVAPFDRDSGQLKGLRFITGGRRRPRRMLYLAAMADRRCDPNLRTFAKRLIQAGKPPKVAIVAVMRKLIEAANLVLQRGQPWLNLSAA